MKRFTGLIVAAVLGVGLLVWYLAKDREDPEQAEQRTLAVAHARIAACLIGQPPGARDERRLREVMIASADDPTWPKRCAPYAEALEKLTKERTAVHLLTSGDPASVFKPEVSWLLRDGRDVKVDFDAVTRGVPRPKEPIIPPDPAYLHIRGVDGVAGYPELAILLGHEVVCQLAAKDGGLEPLARCSFRADAFTSAPRRLALVKGSGAPAFAHDYKVVAPWTTGAAHLARAQQISPSRAGDVIYGIAQSKRTTLLVHEDGATREAPLDRPADANVEMTIAGDQLVWHERGHIFTRSLAGAKPGPVTDLGAAGPGNLRESCIGEAGTLAAAHQLDADDTRHIALRIGDRWKLVGPVGKRDSQLHCLRDRVVVMTVVREDAVMHIERADCTLDGCTQATADVKLTSSEADAVPIGDEVLLVTAHDAIWARRAKLADLAAAKPIPLFNGYGVSAKWIPNSRLVQGVQVLVRGASAIVLLHASGTLAVHVRDGKAQPVRVVYD